MIGGSFRGSFWYPPSWEAQNEPHFFVLRDGGHKMGRILSYSIVIHIHSAVSPKCSRLRAQAHHIYKASKTNP